LVQLRGGGTFKERAWWKDVRSFGGVPSRRHRDPLSSLSLFTYIR
jgi:hypothetical protein